MAKFKVGDKVRVVAVSDLDHEYVDEFPNHIITDPNHEAAQDWQNPAQSFIGQIGEVYEATMNDYYDVSVHFSWMAPDTKSSYETACFKESDLELVK